jgi:hypothetical protein
MEPDTDADSMGRLAPDTDNGITIKSALANVKFFGYQVAQV